MIFLTGGLGFIGSHVAAHLAEKAGANGNNGIVILDNLHNSNISVLTTLRDMYPATTFFFHQGDVRDRDLLRLIFRIHPTIHTVIHLAGLKAVKESFEKTAEYHNVNVGGTEALLDVMEEAGCRQLVFSSSATVYGTAPSPLSEETETGVGITNPYGQTKWAGECLIRSRAPTIRSIILRYFNPIGAHSTGFLGEAPNGMPNNLFPILLKTIKEGGTLSVFGGDWPTRDGTCGRDYVDIEDLAAAHAAAVERFDTLTSDRSPSYIANIGTGRSVTVLELLAAFEAATGVRVPHTIVPRRSGDLADVYTRNDRAVADLGWQPVVDLATSCCKGYLFSIRNQ